MIIYPEYTQTKMSCSWGSPRSTSTWTSPHCRTELVWHGATKLPTGCHKEYYSSAVWVSYQYYPIGGFSSL